MMFLGGLFGSAQGQSVCEISATYEDVSLEKVIKEISETCELAISYDPNRIKGLEVSRLVFKRTPVEEALFRAIEGQQLKVVKIAEGKFSLAPINTSGNNGQVVLRRVSGVVVDGSSGTEMPGVAVVIGDNETGPSNLGVLTDEFGKFEIVYLEGDPSYECNIVLFPRLLHHVWSGVLLYTLWCALSQVRKRHDPWRDLFAQRSNGI